MSKILNLEDFKKPMEDLSVDLVHDVRSLMDEKMDKDLTFGEIRQLIDKHENTLIDYVIQCLNEYKEGKKAEKS